MAHFGEILAELRQDRQLTQKELAEHFHVSIGTISNYEKGVHKPDLEMLCALAHFFHVSTDYLLGLAPKSVSYETFQRTIGEGRTIEDLVDYICKMDTRQLEALTVLLIERDKDGK